MKWQRVQAHDLLIRSAQTVAFTFSFTLSTYFAICHNTHTRMILITEDVVLMLLKKKKKKK